MGNLELEYSIVRETGEELELKIIGAINVFTHHPVKKIIEKQLSVLDNLPYKDIKIVLDLSETRYIDSSALGMLIKFITKYGHKGVKFILKSPSETVINILKLSKTDKLFNIEA